MKELINEFGMQIMQLILTIIVSYAAIAYKKITQKYVNTEEKRAVVDTCVKAIEQVYADLHGDEKKKKAQDFIIQLLWEKGITITETEMDALIESAVHEFNRNKKNNNKIGF